ncbi:MAG: hypothetical protein H7Y00_05840 [Fimbriimonadaceae bacterium]|nr:hypothetical protein [Chitinophagales bacterium]
MKKVLILPIAVIILSAVISLSGKEISENNSRELIQTSKENDMNFEGTATNITVDKKENVQCIISYLGNNKYKCIGTCDENKLFGRFEIFGEAQKDVSGNLSIQFKGDIHFGNHDGSNFKPGTKTGFTMNLNIVGSHAEGNYIINEIVSSKTWDRSKQKGIVDLSLI